MLPSFVITLNLEIGGPAGLIWLHRLMDAPLFAAGSTRMIRNRAVRRGSHGAAGTLIAASQTDPERVSARVYWAARCRERV